jgi:hypothetical protein
VYGLWLSAVDDIGGVGSLSIAMSKPRELSVAKASHRFNEMEKMPKFWKDKTEESSSSDRFG